MSIEGQGHFLTLAQGHLHIKIKTCFSQEPVGLYTPGIYADGYIVFAFPFVHSSVRMFVSSFHSFVEFASKFCVKVSQVEYISATTHQKAFIFGP